MYANPGSLNNYLMRLLKAFKAVPALAGQLQQLDSLNTLIATGAFYAATQTALGQTVANLGADGFFSAIWTARSVAEIDAAAATLAAYLDEGGDLLALADYERRLLRAANLVPVLQNQMTDAAFVGELLGLGNVYASLVPAETTAPTTAEQGLNFFLQTAWSAQKTQQVSGELSDFLRPFSNASQKITALDYQRKLFTTLNQVTSFKGKLSDPSLLSAISILATQYTQDFPERTNGVESNTLVGAVWNASNSQELSTIATNMQQYINQNKTISSSNDVLLSSIAVLGQRIDAQSQGGQRGGMQRS